MPCGLIAESSRKVQVGPLSSFVGALGAAGSGLQRILAWASRGGRSPLMASELSDGCHGEKKNANVNCGSRCQVECQEFVGSASKVATPVRNGFPPLSGLCGGVDVRDQALTGLLRVGLEGFQGRAQTTKPAIQELLLQKG